PLGFNSALQRRMPMRGIPLKRNSIPLLFVVEILYQFASRIDGPSGYGVSGGPSNSLVGSLVEGFTRRPADLMILPLGMFRC
ncbi:hypothetical protein ACIBBE_42745, partial [Streptomyces sp. NPDC051644]|uniref:hypothetical protein n=1 Tax=Streptomyces sp. NPDC051644 TaxID=3365666 RepID=UPI00378F85E4